MTSLKDSGIKLDDYLSSFNESSSRTRKVIGFLVITSVLSLIALINSVHADFNWLSSRSSTKKKASEWFIYPNQPEKTYICYNNDTSAVIENRFSPDSLWNLIAFYRLGDPNLIDSVERKLYPSTLLYGKQLTIPCHSCPVVNTDPLTKSIDLRTIKEERIQLQKLKQPIEANGSISYESMTNELNNLNRAYIENSILVNIPILGVSFDVNYLCALTGVALSILYFVMLYSLQREKKNLKLVFSLAKNGNVDLVFLYQLLSMNQVLTIPASIDEYLTEEHFTKKERPPKIPDPSLRKKFFAFLPFIPIILPFGILLLIGLHDIATSGEGRAINGDSLLMATFGSAWLLIVVNLILLVLCIRAWNGITASWRSQAEKIYKQQHTAFAPTKLFNPANATIQPK